MYAGRDTRRKGGGSARKPSVPARSPRYTVAAVDARNAAVMKDDEGEIEEMVVEKNRSGRRAERV